MIIKIESESAPVVLNLKKNPPKGITVSLPPVTSLNSVDSQDIALALISFVASVPASVLANYLYDRLKGKPRTKIIINRREVQCKKGEILRVIEEQMKMRE
jgi:hypothetical protein